jgi:hypothetical protein
VSPAARVGALIVFGCGVMQIVDVFQLECAAVKASAQALRQRLKTRSVTQLHSSQTSLEPLPDCRLRAVVA